MNCPPNAKLIPLTQGRFAIVDEDMFEELNQFKWYCDTGYAQRMEKRQHVRMSRVVMKAPPESHVDHISMNRLDNRRCNLRLATRAQNGQNRKCLSNNRLGIKGVRKWHHKFVARIRVNTIEIYLGLFPSAEEAALAYNVAAKEYFGEFALLNEV